MAEAAAKNKQKKSTNGLLLGKRPYYASQSSSSGKQLPNRAYSSDYDVNAATIQKPHHQQSSTSTCSTGIRPLVTERSILLATLTASSQDDIRNLPAEELLELGKNFL